MATVQLKIGNKIRKEDKGEYITYQELLKKIKGVSRDNLEILGKYLEITWEKGIIYKVNQFYGYGEFKGENTGFALLGKDTNGFEYMYDRRETQSAGAGQTRLHTTTNSIQVSVAKELIGKKQTDKLKTILGTQPKITESSQIN